MSIWPIMSAVAPSKRSRFDGPLWFAWLSVYMPTNIVPALFQLSNWLCCCVKGLAIAIFLPTSHKRMRPSSWPPSVATMRVPSCDSAWQPTHVVPSPSAGLTTVSAAVCVVLPKSQRRIDLSVVVQ